MTKKSAPYIPRVLTSRQWFWFLLILGLATRLPLLSNSTTENTDGILNLTYFSPDLVDTPRFCILPGYPLMLWVGTHLGLNGILWGRVLAMIASLLFLIPLWRLCRRWMSVEMSGMVSLMALFSPLLWQWSLRVMADTWLLLAFWAGLERLCVAYVDKNERVWVEACLWGALAAFVRPEGFLLAPWILWILFKINKPMIWKGVFFFFLLWAIPIIFLGARFSTIFLAYQEGLGIAGGISEMDSPLLNFAQHLYAYMTQPAFVFTPLLFLLALGGLWRMAWFKSPVGQAWRRIIFPVCSLVFLSRLIPTAYQDRYLLLLLPLFLVSAGMELETLFLDWKRRRGEFKAMVLKNSLLTFGLLYQILFSMLVIAYQSDSFGDLQRSAQFLKTLPVNAVIYSDEIPKTQYWAGRPIRPQILPFNPMPGDYLVLHSFYTPRLGFVDRTLKDRYGAEILHSDSSVIIPILTDLMTDPTLQNRVGATAFRFDPQFFQSVLYQIHR
jgi:hypothetical protein